MINAEWEDITYPDLPAEARGWLCQHRDLVRRFLDSRRRQDQHPPEAAPGAPELDERAKAA